MTEKKGSLFGGIKSLFVEETPEPEAVHAPSDAASLQGSVAKVAM